MKKERIRSKHGFKGFGVFILGWFIGLISTLGILFGVGYWAYTSISVKRIEKWTKSEITDNQGLESLTLKKAVGIISSISSSNNAYTIAKMEEDFGIKLLDDSIYGIKLDTIKNSPIKELSKAINTTIDTATFNNVLSFMDMEKNDLGMLDTILDTQYTYYIYEGKLYTDEQHKIEVGFDSYTIKLDEDIVEFGNGTHTISSNTIKVRFRDLPLNYSMSSLDDAAKNLKIYEILDFERTGTEGNYEYTDDGQPVSGIMASLAEYTIDDLSDQEKFNKIYIYEVMGYKDLGNGEFSYINDSDQEVRVTGAMKAIAGKTIGEMSNPNTLNSLKIYEVLDYYYNTANGKYYEDYDGTNYSNEVTGAMKTLAGKTIEDLSDPDLVNNFYVYEVMGYERSGEDPNYTYKDGDKDVSGIMSTLAGKKISELDDAGAFNDVTVADAMGYYYNTADETYYENFDGTNYSDKVEGLFAHIADAQVSQLSTRINTLTIGQVLDIEESEATGIIKALHGTKIEDLSKEETINSIEVYKVMDYYYNNGKYYQDFNGTTYSNEVTGAMKVLAGKTIGQLSDPNTINNLKVYEVLGYYENGGKYYESFDGTNYSNEISGAIKALAGKSISELNNESTGINSLTLGEVLDVDKDSATTPAIIKALYTSKLSSLNNDIANLQIYQVMGYYENGGKYYTTYDEETETYSGEVTGIMGAIAGSNVNSIDEAIDGLRAVDVFGSDLPILKLFTSDELNGTGGHSALTVMQMPEAVVNKINHEDTTIGTLIDAGVLKVTDNNGDAVTVSNTIRNMTISELIKYVMALS